jgi:type I restriction enzyme S subunit
METANSYPSYRTSGLTWCESIPSHWEIRRISTLGRVGNGSTPSRSNVAYWSETGIPWLNSGTVHQGIIKTAPRHVTELAVKECNLPVVPKGAVVIAITGQGKTRGSAAVLGIDATISQHLAYVAVYENTISGPFLRFCLAAAYGILRAVSNDAGGTKGALTCAAVKRFSVVVPPRPEQDQIGAYLRAQDAHIARFIKAKRDLIALLTEQKLRIIDHAVTRGIDASVKLKPSGIEWLGDVPEHWEVQRLKWVCRFTYGDSLSDASRQHGEIPVYGSNGKIGLHDAANAIGPCIVIGRKGSFGKVNHSESDLFAIDTTFYVDRNCTKSHIRWLYYLLVWCRLDRISKDSAVPGLDRTDACNTIVPVCDVFEQERIAEHLDRETAAIDAAIAKVDDEIALIREYRDRLIADAVTGQVDLRGWQPGPDDVVSDDVLAALGDDDAGSVDEEDANGEED